MSGQGISAQSLSSGNVPQAQLAEQALQAPQQHDPMFDEGQALFARLRANRIQEYNNFLQLNAVQMDVQIDALQIWINGGGPQNQLETTSSKVFLKRLKKYQQEMRRQNGSFGKWISSLYLRLQSQLKFSKEQHHQVGYGLRCSPMLSFGLSSKLPVGADETEWEEIRPLKQQ